MKSTVILYHIERESIGLWICRSRSSASPALMNDATYGPECVVKAVAETW